MPAGILMKASQKCPNYFSFVANDVDVQFTSYGPEVEEMVRDVAVELRRRKLHQSAGEPGWSDGHRGLSMAELNVEAMKVRLCGHTEGAHFCSCEHTDLSPVNSVIHITYSGRIHGPHIL